MSLLWTMKPKDMLSRHWAGHEFELQRGLWRAPEPYIFAPMMWSPQWAIGMQAEDEINPTSGPFIGPPVSRDTEILAWRRWEIELDSHWKPVLASVSRNYRWDGPTVRSDKPVQNGHTGFWALKSRRETVSHRADAWGRVGLSGTVVEGTEGYRAECATVRALWVLRLNSTHDPWILDVLADRYQCPVRFYGSSDDLEETD